MEKRKNPVGWFEIPVKDMDRAIRFYETVLDVKLHRMPMGPLDMAVFDFDAETTGSSGGLVKFDEFYTPSQEGTLVYFTAYSGDLANELERVEPAGGTVLIHKKLIAEDIGYMGLFLDTEGNRVALHSRS